LRDPLLKRIEEHLKRRRISATRFGRESVRDPQLVHDLRCGRYLRSATARRIVDYLDQMDVQADGA
jgi:2,4-dienoyl-CoA reductase-like NADH-dependent reductase (Old Yellow Enzyme family)